MFITILALLASACLFIFGGLLVRAGVELLLANKADVREFQTHLPNSPGDLLAGRVPVRRIGGGFDHAVSKGMTITKGNKIQPEGRLSDETLDLLS